MAKKGRFRRSSRSRGRGFFGRRSRGRSRSNGGTAQLFQLDAMGYGAVRPWVTNLAAPLTNMIPLGAYSDNVVMGGINWLIAKNSRGMLGQIAKKGLVVENALIGADLGGQFLGTGGSSQTTPSVMFG